MSIEDKDSSNYVNCDQKEMKYKPIISEGFTSQDSILAQEFRPLDIKRKPSVCRYIQTGTKTGQEIKSSGYGRSQCRMALGQGPTIAKKQAAKRALQKKRIAKEQQLSRMLTRYPIQCSPLTSHQSQHDDDCCIEPIASLEFDGAASCLVTVHYDQSLRVFATPFSKYGPASAQLSSSRVVKHTEATTSMQRLPHIVAPHPTFSSCDNFLAFHNRIYFLNRFIHKNGKMSPALNLPDSASNAQFFRNESFVIFSSKRAVNLNQLYIPKNCQQKWQQKPVFSWFFPDTVTAVTSINKHLSEIVAVSLSDRSIRILDASIGTECWKVDESLFGRKSAHCLAFSNTSACDTLPSTVPLNFLGASSMHDGGTINLFDVRTAKAVSVLKGSHVNRRYKCNITFSPCMRYLATGSESEGGAIMYDLRFHKNKQHVEIFESTTYEGKPIRDGVVTHVAFNPLYPQCCTASLGGALRFFTESSDK